MPRIRKKTSNRASTNDRAKLRHKVAEGRKKNRKLAKKNPQWKSRVPKDPGIPNSLPFKDQILAEVAEQRRIAEEEKALRKTAGKKKANVADEDESEVDESKLDGPDGVTAVSAAKASLATKSKVAKVTSDDEDAETDAPLLFDPTIPDLGAALDKADVWVHVLDARDPLAHRSAAIEKLVKEKGKKLIFLLNKTDLVPKESVANWLKYLRNEWPAFPFRVSSALLPPPEDNSKGKSKVSDKDGLGVQGLLAYFAHIAESLPRSAAPLFVAFIGNPNSGKSAVIDTILESSTLLPIYKPDLAKVSQTTTTVPQPVIFTPEKAHPLHFIDTPGFDFVTPTETESDPTYLIHDSLVRARGRIEKIKQPEIAAAKIILRANQEDLILHYNTPAYVASDPNSFLSGHARATGRLKRGGVLDLVDSARSLLRDWRVGKLPFYTTSPASTSTSTTSTSTIDSIQTSADEAVLPFLRTRKDMRAVGGGGLVRLKPSSIDEREVKMEAPPRPAVFTGVSKENREDGSSSKGKKVRVVLEGEDDEEEDEAEYSDAEDIEEGAGSDEEEDEEEEEDDDDDEDEVSRTSKRKRVAFADEDEDEDDEDAPPRKSRLPRNKVNAVPAIKETDSAKTIRNKKLAATRAKEAEVAKAHAEKAEAIAATKTKVSKATVKAAVKGEKKDQVKAAVLAKKAKVQKVANAGSGSKKPSGDGKDEAYDFGQFF